MKKTRRDSSKYPYLEKKLSTRVRHDYLDNVDCIDGVYDNKGNLVIRPYTEEELEFLNQFNKEYYNAEFDEDDTKNLHKTLIDGKTLGNIRNDISKIRKELNTPSNNNGKGSKESIKNKQIRMSELRAELNELIEYLTFVYPKKLCTDNNNSINRCLLNVGHATGLQIHSYGNNDLDSIIEKNHELEHLTTNDIIEFEDEDSVGSIITELYSYIEKINKLNDINE